MRKSAFIIPITLVLASCSHGPDKQATPKIDHEGIRQTFLNHQKELHACYTGALKKTKGLAGKLVLDFSIGEGGKVVSAVVSEEKSTLKSNELSDCLLKHVKAWTFPTPPDKMDVQVFYPLAFFDKNNFD